jgi:hypothetical protein
VIQSGARLAKAHPFSKALEAAQSEARSLIGLGGRSRGGPLTAAPRSRCAREAVPHDRAVDGDPGADGPPLGDAPRSVVAPAAATVEPVGGRHGFTIVLTSTLIFAAGGGVLALSEGRDYRARAYVIQVPAALGTEQGVELARSDWVLRQATSLSGVKRLDSGELRRRSEAESTSRLDIALTVEADGPQQAIRLATAYAKAVRRAIPDDEGLPTRGRGARRAEGGLGPFRWPLIGGLLGLAVGVALAIVNDGVRRGSASAPRPASPPYERARRVTRG